MKGTEDIVRVLTLDVGAGAVSGAGIVAGGGPRGRGGATAKTGGIICPREDICCG